MDKPQKSNAVHQREIGMMSVGRSEVDLALLAAREHCGERVQEVLVSVAKGCADARLFFRLCSLQKVILPVHHTLSGIAWKEPLPPIEEAVQLLGQWAFLWPRSRRRLARGADVVHRLMSEGGFDYAFLRGLWFARQYYDFPELRCSSDIDLLVGEDAYPRVEEVFHDAGFRNESCEALHQARVQYVGQSELYHPQWRLRVDLNYRLTGNGGIGAVSGDTTDIWARATQVDGRLWRLSDEDAFLDQIRHMGHGHDFDAGFIMCCMDIAALMRSCAGSMDWDVVCSEASRFEFRRILHFFAHFYDHYYRDESMPALSAYLRMGPGCPTPRECRAFARLVQVPLVRRKHKRLAAFGVFYGNLRFAGKLWGIDRLRRLAKIIITVPWPPRHQLVMLTLEMETESFLLRRLRYCVNPLLPGLPGAVLGIVARLLVAFSHGVRHILRSIGMGLVSVPARAQDN